MQVLVNNAGIGLRAPFVDADPARLVELMNVNIRASTMLTRDIASRMQRYSKGAGNDVFVL